MRILSVDLVKNCHSDSIEMVERGEGEGGTSGPKGLNEVVQGLKMRPFMMLSEMRPI